MPTTTNYGFYSPPLTGVTPNVPRDTKTLADAVDVALKAEETARIAATTIADHADRYQATSQTLTTAVVAGVKFDTAVNMAGITYNNTTGEFTIARAGRYVVNAAVTWLANASGARLGYIMVNGTVRMRLQTTPNAATPVSMTLSKTLLLAASDIVVINAYQNSGGNLNLDNTNRSCNVDISYLGT